MPQARFCMKCGKERPEAEGAAAAATAGGAGAAASAAPAMPSAPPSRPPAVPPAVAPPGVHPAAGPPAAPPPPFAPPGPGYAPGHAPYAPPSRGTLFLRRAFGGDWAGSAKAAAWPTGLLLVLALAISLPSPDGYEEAGLTNWSDRFQVVIALLLQGLGASLDVEMRSGGSLLSLFVRGSGSLSFWPLTITALWAGAVAVGARRLRRSRPAGSGGGAEATLRIALLNAAVVLVLGLCGQPDLDMVTVSTTPVLAALFAGALAGAVSGAVLCREEAAARLGAGARVAVRAWGTALRALGLSVALCGLIVFVVIAAHPDEAGDWAWAGALPFLINLGLMALGLSWGAGVEGSNTEQGRHKSDTLGLTELGDMAGGWAQAGAVLVGIACAVILAVLAARRSADRVEQALSGVFFLATLWLLSFFSGGAMEMTSGTSFSYRSRGMEGEVATNAGELLLFGLLWTAGAILLSAALGRPRGTAVLPHPPMPAAPASVPMAPGTAPGAAASPVPARPAVPPAHPGPAAPTTAPLPAAVPPVAPAPQSAPAAPPAGAVNAAGQQPGSASAPAGATAPQSAPAASPTGAVSAAGQQPGGASAPAGTPALAGTPAPQSVPAASPTGAVSAAGQQSGGASAPAGTPALAGATAPQSAPAASPTGAVSAAGQQSGGASAPAGTPAQQPALAGATGPQSAPAASPTGAVSAAGQQSGGASAPAGTPAQQPAPAGATAPQPAHAASAAPAASTPSALDPAAGRQLAPGTLAGTVAGAPAGTAPGTPAGTAPGTPAGAFGPTASASAPTPTPSALAGVTAQQPVLPPQAIGAAGAGAGAGKPVRAGSRVLMWVAIGLAAFLVGGVGTAGVMLLQERDAKDSAKDPAASASPQAPQQGPAPSGAPSGSPAPSASASAARPRPPQGEPPKGYQRMTSPEGFSLAVPEYWQRENRGNNQIDYHGPTGPGQIRIGIGPSGGKSSYDHFQEMEKQVSAQEEYRQLKMTANTFMGRPGALWEWTWKDKNGEVMHALNQAYVDESGKEYAIMFSERERFYPEARKIFDTALQFWWVGPYDVR
ncbi:hypothetical protein [Streptomyces cinnamoneus]|uniref:hypothetical protein n=1 Tax=Streptomyces cinnamoneus TaxID=53446 RepID=UPI00167EEF25|nr:hypothetical protein [Streptomyces cinnamoneus]